MKPKRQETNRGFVLVEFKDSNSVACSLQESSAASGECVWLGCDDLNPLEFVPHGEPSWRPIQMPETFVANTRMHLNREQAAWLVEELQHFVETGRVRVQS